MYIQQSAKYLAGLAAVIADHKQLPCIGVIIFIGPLFEHFFDLHHLLLA